MNIYILSNRDVVNQNDIAGINGENNAEIMQFHFPEKIVGIDMSKITKWIQFKNDEDVENKLDLLQMIENDRYSLTDLITQYESVEYQVLLMYEELVLWKSKIAELNFDESLDIDVTITLDDLSVLNQLRLQVEGLKTQYEETIKQGDTDIAKLKTEIDELEKSISSSENLRVIAENGRVTAEQERNQKFADLVEEVNNAISNLKHSISEYNENAEEKLGQLSSVASSAVSSVNSEKSSALSAISSAKKTALENIEAKETSSITVIDNETTQKIKEIDENTANKITEFNTNATNKTNTFNTNAGTKTTDFDTNFTEKTDTFNENFEQKLEDFNSDANVERITSLEEENAYQNKLIDGLLNNYDKTTVSGDNITINDCIEAPVNIVINGKEISQKTREGYNLLEITLQSQTINGVEITVNFDGSITLNGTPTTNFNLIISNKEVVLNGDYRFYLLGKNEKINLQGYENGINQNYLIFSNPNETTSRNYESDTILSQVFSHLTTNSSFNKETFKFMITKGTEEKLYESYGQSPSIDYPSPVEYIEGNQKIEHVNENMLCVEDGLYRATNNVLLTVKKGIYNIEISSTITANFGIRVDLKEPLKLFANEEYTLLNGKGTSYPYINLRGIDNNTIISLTYNDHGVKKFTLDEDKIVNYLYIYFSYENGSISFSPMLLKGKYDTIPDFIQNQSETYQLSNLPAMYSPDDYIYKKDGRWYVHNNWNKIKPLIRGIHKTLISDVKKFFQLKIDDKFKSVNTNGFTLYCKCNFLKARSGTATEAFKNNEDGFWWEGNTNAIYLILPFTTIEEAQKWIDENNVSLVYKLETPTDTEITDPILIKQLDELRKLLTYEETNHFIVTSEEGQACNLEVTVYKNSIKIMQKEIDNLKELVLNNVANS